MQNIWWSVFKRCGMSKNILLLCWIIGGIKRYNNIAHRKIISLGRAEPEQGKKCIDDNQHIDEEQQSGWWWGSKKSKPTIPFRYISRYIVCAQNKILFVILYFLRTTLMKPEKRSYHIFSHFFVFVMIWVVVIWRQILTVSASNFKRMRGDFKVSWKSRR